MLQGISSNSTQDSLNSNQADYNCSNGSLGNFTVQVLNKESEEKKTVFCELHPSEEPRLACSLCYVAICDECITESACPAASDQKHSFVKLNKLSDKLKAPLEKLSAVFQKHSTSLNELIKEAQKIREERKLKCEEMKALVEKSRQEQVAGINQNSEKLNGQIDRWYRVSERMVENYSSFVLSIKDNHDHMSGQLLGLVHLALDVEVINEYTPLLEKSKTLLDWKLDALALPALELTSGEKRRELEVNVNYTESVIVIAAQDNSNYGGSSSVRQIVVKQNSVTPSENTADSQSNKQSQPDTGTGSVVPPVKTSSDSDEDPRERLNSLLAHLLELKDLLEVVSERRSIHENISCNSCDKKDIKGIRYKCCVCLDYDLCQDCFGLPRQLIHNKTHIFMKMNRPMKTEKTEVLATYIRKDAIDYGKRTDLTSRTHLSKLKCVKCEKCPIEGTRFRCLLCKCYDLCSSCEAKSEEFHDKDHPLLVVSHPIRT